MNILMSATPGLADVVLNGCSYFKRNITRDVTAYRFLIGLFPNVRKRLGNYRIDPNLAGLPFLNSAAVGPEEPAPI